MTSVESLQQAIQQLRQTATPSQLIELEQMLEVEQKRSNLTGTQARKEVARLGKLAKTAIESSDLEALYDLDVAVDNLLSQAGRCWSVLLTQDEPEDENELEKHCNECSQFEKAESAILRLQKRIERKIEELEEMQEAA